MGRERSISRRRWGALAAFAACFTLAAEARADFDFQLSLTGGGGWMRTTPNLSAANVSTSARDMAGRDIRSRTGLALAGAALDAELVIDDRYRVPLFGGGLAWAVGPYDTTITSHDGSIARLRPWTSFKGDILLPGIGRRFKHRRYMFGAAVRGGISFFSMNGNVAAGAEQAELDLTARTWLVQIELEACRRLDPSTRLCLMVAPRVYEHELLNGFTAGIRMEWGR